MTAWAICPEVAAGGTVILSPHPDDAALSVGGALLLGVFPVPVTVATIFGRSNYMHGGFHPDGEHVTRVRRNEDLAFVQTCGARLAYLELPEAALRPPPAGDRLFAASYGEDFAAPAELERRLREVLELTRPMCVIAPLGLGRHRDHLLLQRAAAAARAHPARIELSYYEDLPYAAGLHEAEIRARAAHIHPRLGRREVAIGAAFEGKLAALGCYASQIGRAEHRAVRKHALRRRTCASQAAVSRGRRSHWPDALCRLFSGRGLPPRAAYESFWCLDRTSVGWRCES